ncbi:MAG: nucleoside monophosphate kinase [Pseudomonadota bacterium]|nr:nucleoside monophosphate kinase [Pseudomonadota bacterium]
MVKIILLGSPGSGKGTQAEAISKHFSIPILTMSALLKKQLSATSALGQEVAKKMREGILIADDIIWQILQAELISNDCTQGYILDGFPRTMEQARLLERSDTVFDLVLHLAIDDATIIKRMEGRRVHPASGRVYHTVYAPPKSENIDDITGEPLMQRDDDKPQVVQKRLDVYHAQTEPVITWAKSQQSGPSRLIKRYAEVDAVQVPKKVWADIQEILKSC